MSKFNINKLGSIILQFKIPMAFDLLDCMKEEDEGEPFIVVINNIPAKIHIERIYEFRYRDEGFQVAPFSKITENRGGILSHSKVQVWFDRQTFDSGNYDKETFRIMPDQFLDLSIEYLNKFIKIYKNITNEYWLRPIMKEDVFNFNSILVRKTPKNSAGSRHSETAYWTRGFSRSSKNNLNIQYKNIRP